MESGQIIDDRYQIIEKLGEGGMGAVWKALDTKHDDEIVIKMPLNHLDSEIMKRFEREARSMRKHSIDCPQILNIENIGTLDGTPWYIMRYLSGGSVIDRALTTTADGPISWDEDSFVWLKKIANALDYLHKKDCFHRDVKPENILFSGEGTPYLVDFGIVKTMNETTSMATDQGKVVGTMAYMAPEILDGGKFTEQSDQYSLAVTLYEFITGERPFSGTTFFSLFRAIQNGHRELRDLHPVIPLAASQIVDRALSSKPQDRFSSCSTFANEFLAGLEAKVALQPPIEIDEPREEETRDLDLEEFRKIRAEKLGQQAGSNSASPNPSPSKSGPFEGGVVDSRSDQIYSPPQTEAKTNSGGGKKVFLSLGLAAGVIAAIAGFGIMYANSTPAGDDSPNRTSSVNPEPKVVDLTKTSEQLFEEAEVSLADSSQSPTDRRFAIEQLKAAALEGHLPSQKKLGEIYLEGDGVDQDFEEAFNWLILAANHDDANSQYLVGLSYAQGDMGVEKNNREAIRWFKKSAAQGEKRAQDALELVEALIEINSPLSKLEKLQLAVENDDAQAQFELATAYEKGLLGLSKNSIIANKFYLKAAENDNLESQLILAKHYDKGTLRIPQSYDDAEKWYRRAESQGDSGAKKRLAELKADGGKTGFLARGGSAQAQYDFGQMLKEGEGVTRNNKEAMKWFRRSALQGNSGAQLEMGVQLHKGIIVEKDLSQAEQWYLKAAKQGKAIANFNLGLIYQYGGSGVEQSDKKAIREYRLAAAVGDKEAKEKLEILLPKTTVNSIGMRFVRVKDGEFDMGSVKSETARKEDELRHRVAIKKDLYVGQYEVTVGQFRKFVNATGHVTSAEKMGGGSYSFNPLSGEMQRTVGLNWRNPGEPVTDKHPVSQVSWDDANSFINWLGKKEGRKYRLPTEAEWEYAARGGSNSTYATGNTFASLDGFANVSDQSRANNLSADDQSGLAPFNDGYKDASPVGSYRPNKFGLHDMHGNLWEWCFDSYDSEFYKTSGKQNPFSNNGDERKIMRGGCFL